MFGASLLLSWIIKNKFLLLILCLIKDIAFTKNMRYSFFQAPLPIAHCLFPHRGRYFTFWCWWDKVDKVGTWTREETRTKPVRLRIIQKSLKTPIFVCNIFLVTLSSFLPCLALTQLLKTCSCELFPIPCLVSRLITERRVKN